MESNVEQKNVGHPTTIDVNESGINFADSQHYDENHKLVNGTALNGKSKTKVRKILSLFS